VLSEPKRNKFSQSYFTALITVSVVSSQYDTFCIYQCKAVVTSELYFRDQYRHNLCSVGVCVCVCVCAGMAK
jgi:hypothetical protein